MIQSVQKAITILNILSSGEQSPVPLKTLAEKAGIPKPTCAHLIATLEAEGYAVKVSATKGYMLGPAAYCLSASGRYRHDFIALCRPVMQYLHKHLGHSIVLAVMEGNTKYIIDYIDDGKIFEQKRLIRKDDIYRTATGRVLLCNLPEEQMYAVYEKYGAPAAGEWDEARTFTGLLTERERILKTDMEQTRNISHPGFIAAGYAMPLFDATRCVGALGVAVSIPEEEEQAFAEQEIKIRKLLQKGAATITHRLKNI